MEQWRSLKPSGMFLSGLKMAVLLSRPQSTISIFCFVCVHFQKNKILFQFHLQFRGIMLLSAHCTYVCCICHRESNLCVIFTVNECEECITYFRRMQGRFCSCLFHLSTLTVVIISDLCVMTSQSYKWPWKWMCWMDITQKGELFHFPFRAIWKSQVFLWFVCM